MSPGSWESLAGPWGGSPGERLAPPAVLDRETGNDTLDGARFAIEQLRSVPNYVCICNGIQTAGMHLAGLGDDESTRTRREPLATYQGRCIKIRPVAAEYEHVDR